MNRLTTKTSKFQIQAQNMMEQSNMSDDEIFPDCKIEIVEPDTPLLKKNKLGRLGKMI